ncbi:hypothetical protein [Clostridium tarantellae]|uniref:CBM6 domain-containing protein n=1 Tax=Clostridium tarantellae TaxID=39493 RepID=A0A6I1MN27_9CLOT|nr:hypothetical protein [Clostridium tarantellae]MPQ44896.1 hypothetical protein [Clostridium tarantellae]
MNKNNYNFFPQGRMTESYPILVGVYPASKGLLEIGAFVDSLSGFVKLPPGASVTIEVDVDTKGFPFGAYEFEINYVSITNSVFKVDVNGKNTDMVYSAQVTESLNSKDSKKLKIMLQLTSGKNKVKFYSYAKNFSPDIGNITVNIVPNTFPAIQPTPMPTEPDLIPITPPYPKNPYDNSTSYKDNTLITYDLAVGNLNNGASLDNSTNFVMNIGGMNEGSSTMLVNVDTFNLYTLGIKYLSGDKGRPLKIQINEDKNTMAFILPPTKSWSLNDVEIFKINVLLKKGINEIKFYNQSVDYAPHLGHFTIEPFKNKISSSITLIGSSILNGDFIEGINSNDGNEIVLNIDIQAKGIYDFAIHYVADENKQLKIDINGVNTGITYTFDKTASLNVADEKIKVIQIPLISGKNTIRLYN